MDKKCPQCHKENIVQGRIYNQPDYVDPKAYFRPDGLPFYAFFGTNVCLENSFCACTFCGFIWSKMNAERLLNVLAKTSAYRHQKKSGSDNTEAYELKK